MEMQISISHPLVALTGQKTGASCGFVITSSYCRRPAHSPNTLHTRPVNASRDKLVVGGHLVYSAYFEGGMGYRIDKTRGVATGDEAETL